MTPVEERLRTTLRERVRDVATQPALYRRVQERADRRRRLRRLAAVPAGLAALGVAVAVPLLVQGAPDVPRIEDVARQLATDAGPNAPRQFVVVRDGEVERFDVTTAQVEPLGARVEGTRLSLASQGVGSSDDGFLASVLSERGPELTRLTPGGGGQVDAGLDAAGDGGVVVSPDGRWTGVLGTGDGIVDLHTLPNAEANSDLVGTARVSLPAGSTLQDWTTGAQPGTTAVLVRTAQGQLRSVEVEEADRGDRSELRASPNQTDLAALLPTTVLAAASSHLQPERELGGPVYSLVPTADGVRLRVTEGGATTAERDVTELLDDVPTGDVWLDAWGDAAVFGDGGRTWLVARDPGGDLLAPQALPDGVTRAAPIAQEIVRPDVAAAPGDPEHALLVLDDGTLVADDLTTGERTELHPPVNRNMTVHSFTVSVGSTIDDFVAAGYDDGASDDLGIVTYVRRDGGQVVASLARAPDVPGWSGNRAPYAISPDGRWLAYGGMADDGLGLRTRLVPIDAETGALQVGDVVVLDGVSVRPADWSGAVGEVGDRSRIVGWQDERGVHPSVRLERTATGFDVVDAEPLVPFGGPLADPEEIQQRVAFTSQPGSDDAPRFEATYDLDDPASSAALLRYGAGDDALAERIVPLGRYTGNLHLAARGRTALLVTSGPGSEDEPGGRALIVRAEPTEDGADLLLPIVLERGPVAGALLGGHPAD